MSLQTLILVQQLRKSINPYIPQEYINIYLHQSHFYAFSHVCEYIIGHKQAVND